MKSAMMEYIPTQGGDGAKTPAGKDLPALGLATVRGDYTGRKAFDYDLGRENCDKWRREFEAVRQGLNGITGPLLDIPCGTGRFFPLYREHGLVFTGMDVSEDMMTQARARDATAEVVYGDIERIPLTDKGVECSICIRLLEKLPEEEMAVVLKELGRVTTRRILAGNIVGPAAERRRRSYVHRTPVFETAVGEAGFKIAARAPIRDPEMNVWILEAL